MPTRPLIPMVIAQQQQQQPSQDAGPLHRGPASGAAVTSAAAAVVAVASARLPSARPLLLGSGGAGTGHGRGSVKAVPCPPASEQASPGCGEDTDTVAARFAESRLALRRHRLAGRWDLAMSFEAVRGGGGGTGESRMPTLG